MVGNMKVLLINIADWYKSTEPGLWGKGQMMKRKKHTEEQIIATLKEYEAGMKTADLCRKYGISEATFYNWKAKYGRSPRLSRLKGLESENAKLKKLLADAMLDNAALKDLLAKKW
jgi:putative transposase